MSPIKEPQTPTKFIKPAELFKLRKVNRQSACFTEDAYIQGQTSSSSHSSSFFSLDSQSPLKCLHNFTEPSPTKKLPVLLRNPLNRPVKRQLNLAGSPNKRSRMLAVDEDANLEPPKSRQRCPNANWPLAVNLQIGIKLSKSDIKPPVDSIESAAVFYQYPYFPWDALFPRINTDNCGNNDLVSLRSQPEELVEIMYTDWIKSLDNLIELLVLGRCPYFYICSNSNTILFRASTNTMQAFISPFSEKLEQDLTKSGIKYDYSLHEDNLTTPTQSQFETENDDLQNEDETDVKNYNYDYDNAEFLQEIGIKDQLTPQITKVQRPNNSKPIASITGIHSIRKLVRFIKSSKSTIVQRSLSRFSCVPPTLLAPCQFRNSTARCPTIKFSNYQEQPLDSICIELDGPILPTVHVNIHNILTRSNFNSHQCHRKVLDSTKPFSSIADLP